MSNYVSLGEGLYARLSELSVGTRVYPKRLPQNVQLPACVYHVISGPSPITGHDDAHDNDSELAPRSEIVRIQIDCWADDHQTAENLCNEVTAALHANRGMWGSLEVRSCLKDIMFDDQDQDTEKWRFMVDFKVHFIGGVVEGS